MKKCRKIKKHGGNNNTMIIMYAPLKSCFFEIALLFSLQLHYIKNLSLKHHE